MEKSNKKLKVGDKVCWRIAYGKVRLCGTLKDLGPSIAPGSYKVKLDNKSLSIAGVKNYPIIYPLKQIVRKN